MTGFAPKYDLFVFDWDGTVMDTTALIAKGIQHAAREMGYPVPSFQDACGVIGLDWRGAILKVVPDCPESEHLRFGEIYRAARGGRDPLPRHARVDRWTSCKRPQDGGCNGQES